MVASRIRSERSPQGPRPAALADAITPVAGSIQTLADRWEDLSKKQRADLLARAASRVDAAILMGVEFMHPRDLHVIPSPLQLRATLRLALEGGGSVGEEERRSLVEDAVLLVRAKLVSGPTRPNPELRSSRDPQQPNTAEPNVQHEKANAKRTS